MEYYIQQYWFELPHFSCMFPIVISIFGLEILLMRNVAFLLLMLFAFVGCQEESKPQLSEGIWLAQLEVQDGKVLPFNFKLTKAGEDYHMQVYNAEEIIDIDEIEIDKDSITIKMPVYEGYIAGTFSNTGMTGSFIKESLDRVVPFHAEFNMKDRFEVSDSPKTDVSGVWETEFNPKSEDSYIAKGIFKQTGDQVTGTFRTTTGDYRYLEGVLDGDSLKLSTFDGAHAFLFTAKVTDSTLDGTFYSGNHSKEPFLGRKNENFELPDEDSLTYLKTGYDRLEFSFPDEERNMVSLNDKRFKDKAVIVQIMGTWCPNCLDETKFLANFVESNPKPDLEIIALAFEYAKTKEKAFSSIERLKKRIGVEYPILLAQYGTSDKNEANKKLPMLNHVLSYPTTIFIDKKGAVRKIHTGFNGPATGEKFTEFKKEFKALVEELVSE